MKLIQSPLFWCGLLLIAVGIGVAVKLTRRKDQEQPEKQEQANQKVKAEPKTKEFGFRDAVKDPEGWAEQMEEGDRDFRFLLAEAKNWNDQKLSTELRHFVFEVRNSREAPAERRVLQKLASRVEPVAVRYLGDKTLRERLVTPTEKGVLPETPFHRLCMLLEDSPSTEGAAALLPFLDQPSPEIRKSAIIIVAATGSESVVAPVRKAFGDSDEYVRSYAIIGLQRAAKAGRLSDACRTELFEDLRRLIADGKNGDNGVGLFFELNERRAQEWLLSEKCLTPEFPSLHHSLRALNGRGSLVPRDKLLNLIDRLEPRGAEYPFSYQLGEVLLALGKHHEVKDRERLEHYLTHAERIVVSGAATGLLASHGLEDFRKRIWESRTPLTIPQQHYNSVARLDGEVCNGGFSQYFFNSSGDDWREALAGLEAMGSKERLAIFREVLAKFGTAGPSEKREERMEQLAKVERASDRAFNQFDSRYYSSTEVIDVMVMRYVLKHPEAFR